MPRNRPPRPLLAVRRALGRGPDQPGAVQGNLRYRVAERVSVPLGQLLVEMLDGEVGVLVPVEPEHPLDFLLRRPPRRRPAALVDEPRLAFRLVPILPALKRANAHPQKLRRRILADLPALPPQRSQIAEKRIFRIPSRIRATSMKAPPQGLQKTRHFTRYELTSLHKLATIGTMSVALGAGGNYLTTRQRSEVCADVRPRCGPADEGRP